MPQIKIRATIPLPDGLCAEHFVPQPKATAGVSSLEFPKCKILEGRDSASAGFSEENATSSRACGACASKQQAFPIRTTGPEQSTRMTRKLLAQFAVQSGKERVKFWTSFFRMAGTDSHKLGLCSSLSFRHTEKSCGRQNLAQLFWGEISRATVACNCMQMRATPGKNIF
jgi:hypothetical protein